MKALSVWQPWAWALVQGYKPCENRTWKLWKGILGTTVAIHGASTHVPAHHKTIRSMTGVDPSGPSLDCRAIVGVVDIVDCIPPGAPAPAHVEPWRNPEGYAFVVDNALAIPDPIPIHGALGFWQLPDWAEINLGMQLDSLEDLHA